MSSQIKLKNQTKLNLDSLEVAQWVPLKTYDQKISFLYWFYETYGDKSHK